MQGGQVDAIASILQLALARKGISKKELKTKLGLQDKDMNDYVAAIISKKLAKFVVDSLPGNERLITVTERGIKFLELYEAIRARYLSYVPSK